jgi:ATP-dependent helicase/DNAse subunit B
MAEHLRHQLAREGLILRKHTVSTLTGFIDQLQLSRPAPHPADFESIIARQLEKRCPPDYQPLASQPGFIRHLASSFDALALAAVSPQQLDPALADIYSRTLNELTHRKLALRGHRLAQATASLNATHLQGISNILLDGFFSFSNTEQAFLDRLATLVPTTLTLPTSGESQFRHPAIEVLATTDRTHEAHLIASRVLALAAQGIELRRIGILLRNPAAYAPLLESTFARLKIPSRSYLGTPLSAHPILAFHRAFLEAVASGWDNAKLLSALRWRFTGLGGTPQGDTLEQQVRAALPSTSLELFPQLQPFAAWPAQVFPPSVAAAHLKSLHTLLEPPTRLDTDWESAWRWHQRASALRTLHQVIADTASTLEEPLTLNDFWRSVEANIASLTLHERDNRRNVVHIMDLFESRQWDLDYVFAPGIAEGEFPQRFYPDPLLPESIKKSFGMKTLEDRSAEEHFLYEMLLTRSSQQLTLLHPRTNSKGDPVFPSPLLTTIPQPAVPVQIATPPTIFTTPAPQLHRNYRQPRPWSASEFETYLACPWKHFASRGLELQPLPETPSERLNPLLLGNVAHESIKLWTLDPSRDIESIGERELERACRKVRAPFGYNYERERINLLRHLRLYSKNAPPIPAGWQAFLEQPFSIELNEGPAVRGQIDRYDQSPTGEIHAYDYKYSKANNLDEKYPIQGALYAIALGTSVTRFSYVALRDQSRPTPIEGDTLRNSITLARQEIARIVEAVSTGLIPVEPSQRDNCQYCDFIDACRIRARAADEEEAPLAEGAEA